MRNQEIPLREPFNLDATVASLATSDSNWMWKILISLPAVKSFDATNAQICRHWLPAISSSGSKAKQRPALSWPWETARVFSVVSMQQAI